MKTQKQLPEYTWEELLDYRNKILQEQENLEAAISVIKDEVIQRLDAEKIEGKVVGDQAISIRKNYTCEKDVAESLGAITVITQKRIDVKLLKELHFKGVEIPGLVITKTPIITQVKSSKEENS
jgi:hypothetical protein